MSKTLALALVFACSLVACVDSASHAPPPDDTVIDGSVAIPPNSVPPCAGCTETHTRGTAGETLEVHDRDGTELCRVIVDHDGRAIVDTCGVFE